MLPPFRIFIRSRRCHTEQPLHCRLREINLAILLRFLSYSPATEREHYATVKVLRCLFARIPGCTCYIATERREQCTSYVVHEVTY